MGPKYIIRTYPARIEIPAVSEINEELKLLLNVKHRAKRIQFAHAKKQEGMTINEIALVLHTSPKTITKYLNIESKTVDDKDIAREIQH